MKNKRTLLQKLVWIFTVSKRFSRVDRSGRSAVTSKLATAGIVVGVMTLIVVMGIMNGFQLSFIDSIQEISSFHVRVNNLSENEENAFVNFCNQNAGVKSCTQFLEAQTLMASQNGYESASLLRAVDPDIYLKDEGFNSKLNMVQGRFDLSDSGNIILGSSLAKSLKVRLGDTVNLLVLSGSSDVDLFSQDRTFKIAGIFTSGYKEINSTFAFINIEDGYKYFGNNPVKTFGIKINNVNHDSGMVNFIKKVYPDAKVESWRTYNKTFFGTLRIEKNMLLLLVALIFVVVAINIYNGMRRLVFERKAEIAIFSALGAPASEIKAVFTMRGVITGLVGSLIGLVLGLLICYNTAFVFTAAAKIMYLIQYATTAIFNHKNLAFVSENSSYLLYATIPARVIGSEVFLITLFGFISPVIACFAASQNVLKLTVAEVLHNE